ncbi:MAG: hypothetical protein LUC26_03615 [Prevotella sp.]|nr:hypothetical protein [Prevotella sp.]
MKSRAILTILAAALAVSAVAQEQAVSQEQADNNMFNHLAAGITVGTPGIGADVAAPIGNYVQVRAGFATFPQIKYSTSLDVYVPEEATTVGYNIPGEVEVEGKTGFTNGKILVDVFPFKRSSFHVTAGAYFGGSTVVKVGNKVDGALSEINRYNANEGINDPIGLELGDYLITPDADGNINAKIKTNAFKPYLGLGMGRAVPKKRVGFMFELGCQFWGSPKVYCNGERLEEDKVGESDGGIIKTLSKIKVYPVMNFRLCGRIL